MPKAKYYFNTSSLRYEKVVVSFRRRLLRVLGWLATASVFGFLTIILAYSYLDSPKEKQLKRELNEMQLQYEILQQRTELASRVLSDLSKRDDQVYRVIFEAEPINEAVRTAGYGGTNRYKDLEGFNSSDLMIATTRKIDQLSRQLYIQSKSYDEVFVLAKQKTEMLASIPGIQPLFNKDLNRIASGFGFRIHPIYKTSMMHEGLDFTAPIGTEIYSTGNGVVAKTELMARGYGNNVLINHGFGYQTLYAHMIKFKVRAGQRIKRGDVIGYVGNTGSSTGPHLHYEVWKNGVKIDPINFFFNDLTAEQYAKVVEIASRPTQSFD